MLLSIDGVAFRHEFNRKDYPLRSQNTVAVTFCTEWTVLNFLVSLWPSLNNLTPLCHVLSTHYIVTIKFHEFPTDTRDDIVPESQKTDDRSDLARADDGGSARRPIHLKNSPWLNKTSDRHARPPTRQMCCLRKLNNFRLAYGTLVTLLSGWYSYKRTYRMKNTDEIYSCPRCCALLVLFEGKKHDRVICKNKMKYLDGK